MKTILITKDNAENFAEEMFKFNCNNTYNSLCFSCSDIKREQHALNCTDAIIEEMDKAGFNMTAIQAFKQHNWKVDDLVSPNKVLFGILLSEKCNDNELKAYDANLDFTEADIVELRKAYAV